MYVEPCCADRQLPELLKDRSFAFFQTSGDVTVAKLLHAVSFMAGPTHVMVMAIPEADHALLQTLKTYMTRGWTKALLLLTATDQADMVRTELGQLAARVQYACDPMVIDGIVACIGEEKAMVCQGALLPSPDFSLSQYVIFAGRDRQPLIDAIAPVLSKLSMKPLIDHIEDCREIGETLIMKSGALL